MTTNKPKMQDSIGCKGDYEDWHSLILLTENMLLRYKGTPLEASLTELQNNIAHIESAITVFPDRQERPYVRRFKDTYVEICIGSDLLDYYACASNTSPGDNAQKLMRLVEEKFSRLARVSELLLDDVYGNNLLSLSADNEVLNRIFAQLEKTDDFQIQQTKESVNLSMEDL